MSGNPLRRSIFPDSVTVHPRLDAETVAVAAHLGVGNVWWMNVFDGVHTARAMQLLAVGDRRPRGQSDMGSVLAAAKLDLFGRQPYFTIVGTAHGGVGSTTVVFTCSDSYRITGALAAFAAERVADMPVGAHPFWRVDEPWRALEVLDRSRARCSGSARR